MAAVAARTTDGTDSHLRCFLETAAVAPDEIVFLRRRIYDEALRSSPCLDDGNFTSIQTADLRRLFDLYDGLFFRGLLRAALDGTPLAFRLSSRMTRAGGKTTWYTRECDRRRLRYEICVATALLFQCFTKQDHRAITVVGLTCRDRLEALQGVMEHEAIHLAEILAWGRTNCAAKRFQSVASRLLGHQTHTHTLITPKERALAAYGIRQGDRVRFEYDGQRYTGLVRRITRRATVLVRDQRGDPYADGHRYATFYVPLGQLQRVA